MASQLRLPRHSCVAAAATAVDGVTARLTEDEMIGRLLQARRAGERVPVTVLRGAERVELTSRMR